jgi:C4-type Zn-finger protein
MLWPTYALRAWLTALLGLMERAKAELDTRIEYHEKEIGRLRAQIERSGTVITSLQEAIKSVDNVLRRTRDQQAKSEVERSTSETRELSKEPDQDHQSGAAAQSHKTKKTKKT